MLLEHIISWDNTVSVCVVFDRKWGCSCTASLSVSLHVTMNFSKRPGSCSQAQCFFHPFCWTVSFEYRNSFCFPHVCIHCSALLYLVHDSGSAIVNEQNIDTQIGTFGWQVTFNNMNPALNRSNISLP